MSVLPALAQLAPVRDEHAWHFPNTNLHRTHVRMRAWPTADGASHLVVATDFMLGGGLVNMAECLYQAAVREFGEPVTVVRHFPTHTMLARENDRFDLLTLDEAGVARTQTCTDEIIKLLGPGVLGFPGDEAATDGAVTTVMPQSVQMARMQAAALRLKQSGHGTVVGRDLDAASQLSLGTGVLERLADFLANALVEDEGTEPGDARERKLEKIVATLKAQAWELVALADELESESRARR
ncbi:hypothetical protein ABZ746_23605 [Streptomyces sp. NPDC020096]